MKVAIRRKAAEAANEVLQMIGTEEVSPDSLHIAHTILGHLALDDNNMDVAVCELLRSADVSSSPVLSSFGPKFTLATRLLKRGKRNAVAAYLKKVLVILDERSGSPAVLVSLNFTSEGFQL